jgi:hypothetical protein
VLYSRFGDWGIKDLSGNQRPSLLLLDCGFYSVEVIRYLQAARYAFIMPVIIRGRDANDPRGPSATRVFAVQKHSGWARYTLTNSEKMTATVRICIHCRNWAGQRKRHGRQALVYALWGIQPKTTHWVYQIYRLRFGIETSYRQLHEVRIKTTTRNPQVAYCSSASLYCYAIFGCGYIGITWPARDAVGVSSTFTNCDSKPCWCG